MVTYLLFEVLLNLGVAFFSYVALITKDFTQTICSTRVLFYILGLTKYIMFYFTKCTTHSNVKVSRTNRKGLYGTLNVNIILLL